MLLESMRINPCGSARVMKPLNEASHSGEGGPAVQDYEYVYIPLLRVARAFSHMHHGCQPVEGGILNYLEETPLTDVRKEHPAQIKLIFLYVPLKIFKYLQYGRLDESGRRWIARLISPNVNRGTNYE